MFDPHRLPVVFSGQPIPWSLTATLAERMVDALQSLLPRK
jgi:hypothetical protein